MGLLKPSRTGLLQSTRVGKATRVLWFYRTCSDLGFGFNPRGCCFGRGSRTAQTTATSDRSAAQASERALCALQGGGGGGGGRLRIHRHGIEARLLQLLWDCCGRSCEEEEEESSKRQDGEE